MIPQRHYPVEPWRLRELGLDLGELAQSESLFALSNGHIGGRGNLVEGDPNGLPGTYLNSFYETRPLPYAEAGYGYPESGQTILNVTNGKLIRLLVDDEPFDLRYGTVSYHERVLDLRSGILSRTVEWANPAGRRIRLYSHRLVSLTQRSILAIRYEVEAVDDPVRIVISSELVANEQLPAQSADPRVAAVLENALQPVERAGRGSRALLVHRTAGSQLSMAAAMDHVIRVAEGYSSELTVEPNWARLMIGHVLEPGERCSVDKFVSYGWSGRRSVPALRDQVEAALVAATHAGWDDLAGEQRTALDTFWAGADVEVDGPEGIQQAVRFALFHTYQAAARAERRAIPAKGLTGPGYNGHAFWDTESFVLPVLTATAPHAAADALRWRHSILEPACERARTLHLKGASFPWRTIRGHECSAYWPAGSAAMHVNADIAVAALRYVQWTGDEEFEREHALPIYVQTARLWHSLGYHGSDGRFHIDGVTGPDEYTALVNDNIFTNLMAQRNLLAAADACERHPDHAGALQVSDDEVAAWRHDARHVAMPFDEVRGVYQQDRGFTDRQVWDFQASADADAYPLLLNATYFDLYRKQVIKQADLILAMHWCGDAFTLEDKARAFAYYEPLTVRDSSLSACTQAVIAAEVGQLELAADYAAEAALIDLHDLQHNSGNGLHIASLAGTWLALVAGFGGMRDHGGRLSFCPRLPPGWRELRFTLRWRDSRVRVAVNQDETEFLLVTGPAEGIEIDHAGQPVRLRCGRPERRPVHRITPLTPRPAQPAGRAPISSAELE
jgi:alpha,alpha-trehalose phosphorylase